jgi:prolyl oligopeptidase
MLNRLARFAILPLVLALPRLAAAQSSAATQEVVVPQDSTTDPFIWLEDQYGPRSMAWVHAENAKTVAVLEKDPHFDTLYRQALEAAQAPDRIPGVQFMAGALYNFWRDSAHVRGIWRRTTMASYRTEHPQWTTVLDLDSLSTAEKANWVWRGANCAEPAERRCMISLSDGGEDAVTIREFDVGTRAFVPNGFVLPKGKQRLTWLGTDTLLVSREWNPGELTSAGYPYIVKAVVRGEPLASAKEVFRGDAGDGGYGVSPFALYDGAGHRMVLIDRPLDTFKGETYVLRSSGVARLNVPEKARPMGMLDGQVLIRVAEPWAAGGTTVPSGAIASFALTQAERDPAHLTPTVVFAPGPRESIGGGSTTRDRLVLNVDENVRGRVYVFTRSSTGTWTRKRLPLPDNLTTGVGDGDLHGTQAFVSVTGFLTPTSLWLVNAPAATLARIKSEPAQFDASHDTVEQREATSTDGTQIPYFIVHPKGMKLDGANPTILTAYGGFEVSRTPSYSATVGKLWLERGGVYVLGNIRGGGEFGPAWHEAGLKTKRQIIYDDFASVARDLIARHVTDTAHLGIMGGSNGGLLMGVEFTQHPELWKAVDIQVPLLDMLRYEYIDAGASWVGEYGSVKNPEERAFLAHISPYNNLEPGMHYPEPLIWTTTKDDRVGPQHARKFAAKMASMGYPYLFYEVIEGGHGAGANAKQTSHTNALEYTYFMRKLMPSGGGSSAAGAGGER